MSTYDWEPPQAVTEDEAIADTALVDALPDRAVEVTEDVFRISVLDMDWDVAGKVYAPVGAAQTVGADGRKAGIFVLHGGGGDHRRMEPLALVLARKYGYKVATMTHLGQVNLLDDSRDWPGDTIEADGTPRVPIWCVDDLVTPDEYELVEYETTPEMRAKSGTMFFLRAKEGTRFYYRMAAWPLAFEEAMKAVCARNFPPDEFSVYSHGHSTGGPFAHLLLQRIPNMAGLVGADTSPFGAVFGRMNDLAWDVPFNYMSIRTWRDIARYIGPEVGPEGMLRLPQVMEEVFEAWDERKPFGGIKCQQPVHFGAVKILEDAARAISSHLGYGPSEEQALVEHYRDYVMPLQGDDASPLPPLLYAIAGNSRDHQPAKYREVYLPVLEALDRPPKVRFVEYANGAHVYWKPEEGLPQGIMPSVARLWDEAIRSGYYVAA